MATLEINVWGEKLKISSDQGEDFIRDVADYLNGKMTEVQKNDSTLITTKIAALRAAYCIAAEYVMIQQQMDKLELTVDQIDEQLLRLTS